VYGARPMKRLIQSQIETLIARTLIEGKAAHGDTLRVQAAEQGNFKVEITKPAEFVGTVV